MDEFIFADSPRRGDIKQYRGKCSELDRRVIRYRQRMGDRFFATKTYVASGLPDNLISKSL
jgi:hypothetical protein